MYLQTALNTNWFIKKSIIFFFIYMIIEGILRKWLLPDFQTQIYFLKDFFLIFIYSLALKQKIFFKNKISKLIIIFAIFFSIVGFLGHEWNKIGLLSYLMGIRSYFLYLPLTILVMNLFTTADIIKFFKVNLFFIIPYIILTLLQNFSETNSIINSGFNGIVNHHGRPNGYFLYTTQNVYYLMFLVVAFFSILLNLKNFTTNKILIYSILFFLLTTLVILLKSRYALFLFIIIIFFSFCFIFFKRKKKTHKTTMIIFICIIIPLIILINIKIFNKDFFYSFNRINTDTYLEMNLVKKNLENEKLFNFCVNYSSVCRVWNDVYFMTAIQEASLIGKGIGSGTSTVAVLNNKTRFSLGEVENTRVIMELGYLFGTFFVFFKFFICLYFSFLFLIKFRDLLVAGPLLIFVGINLLSGPVTYSVAFTSFIFWFSLGLLLCFFNKHFKFNKK
jgi:hypothetical protein